MTLAEAYERREAIGSAGKKVYTRGRKTGLLFLVIFLDSPPANGWYSVLLGQDDTTTRQVMMPGDIQVLVQ